MTRCSGRDVLGHALKTLLAEPAGRRRSRLGSQVGLFVGRRVCGAQQSVYRRQDGNVCVRALRRPSFIRTLTATRSLRLGAVMTIALLAERMIRLPRALTANEDTCERQRGLTLNRSARPQRLTAGIITSDCTAGLAGTGDTSGSGWSAQPGPSDSVHLNPGGGGLQMASGATGPGVTKTMSASA